MWILRWCISKVEGSRDGSGESTRVTPVWLGLDSRCSRHMWVEFVISCRPCSEIFSPGTPVFLPPQTTNVPKFQFDLETLDERATLSKPVQFPFSYNLHLVIGSAVTTLRSRCTVVAKDACFKVVFLYFCNLFSLQVHLGSSSLPWRLIDLLSKRQPLSIAYLRSYLAPP